MADIINSVGVLIAALSFLAGVSAWKREFVGKRRIELAESVLAKFYEAEDAIREIRNPFGHVGEGGSRQRDPHENPEEERILDQAYVVFERYKKHEKLFAGLRAMRYQCMASFGQTASEPFNELSDTLNQIFSSARILGTHYWPRQGRAPMSDEEFQKHLEGMRKHEAIFWFSGDEDEISPKIRGAVGKMEKITKNVMSAQTSLFQDWWAKVMNRVRPS